MTQNIKELRKKIYFQYIQKFFIVIIFGLLLSVLLVYGTTGVKNHIILILTLSIFLGVSALNKKTHWILLCLALIAVCLNPFARLTGGGLLTVDTLNILVSKNMEETKGLLENLPTRYYVKSLAFFFVLWLLLKLSKSDKEIVGYIYNGILRIVKVFYDNGKLKVSAISIASLFLFFGILFGNLAVFSKPIYESLYQVSTNQFPSPTWKAVGERNSKYKTYVIILGESTRKDFMSSYGFPVPTTPYIDSIPHIRMDSFISPGPNTTISVPRMFALSEGMDVDYQNNIIQLVSQTNMKTYWLEAQGFLTKWNVTQNIIASYANKVVYVKRHADYNLIPEFEKVLKSDSGDKLIILHTYGLHTDYCQRLDGFNNLIYPTTSKRLNCYINGVRKADDFFRRVDQLLKKDGKPYSLLFVADHGVNIVPEVTDIREHRTDKVKVAFDTPFIMTSSDLKETHSYSPIRSGRRFPHFVAQWIGISTSIADKAKGDFFTGENDYPRNRGYTRIIEYPKLPLGETAIDLYNKYKKE